MKVLGFDLETQCLNLQKTRITEVGAILYEYQPGESNQFHELKRLSMLCHEPDYPKQTEDIVALTSISDDLLKKEGLSRSRVFTELLPLVLEADLIIAHRIQFDRTVINANFDAVGMAFPKKEWLCTLTNFPWKKGLRCHILSHLAYEHGIMVDPTTLHRATEDIQLMMRTIDKYNFDEVLAYMRTPWIYLKADALPPWKDEGVQNGIAKGLKFSYESIHGDDTYKWPKKWVRRVKTEQEWENICEAVRKSPSPFRIDRIEGV